MKVTCSSRKRGLSTILMAAILSGVGLGLQAAAPSSPESLPKAGQGIGDGKGWGAFNISLDANVPGCQGGEPPKPERDGPTCGAPPITPAQKLCHYGPAGLTTGPEDPPYWQPCNFDADCERYWDCLLGKECYDTFLREWTGVPCTTPPDSCALVDPWWYCRDHFTGEFCELPVDTCSEGTCTLVEMAGECRPGQAGR